MTKKKILCSIFDFIGRDTLSKIIRTYDGILIDKPNWQFDLATFTSNGQNGSFMIIHVIFPMSFKNMDIHVVSH